MHLQEDAAAVFLGSPVTAEFPMTSLHLPVLLLLPPGLRAPASSAPGSKLVSLRAELQRSELSC